MKRRIWWLLITLILGLSWGISVLADTTVVETTKTTVGFYRTKKTATAAADHVDIPDGQRAYQLATTKPKSPALTPAADHILSGKRHVTHGVLPQTGEWRQWLWSLMGSLAVVILLLLALIWRQWQQLKLGGDRDC